MQSLKKRIVPLFLTLYEFRALCSMCKLHLNESTYPFVEKLSIINLAYLFHPVKLLFALASDRFVVACVVFLVPPGFHRFYLALFESIDQSDLMFHLLH